MACAYENVKYLIKEDIIGHVQRLAPVFEDCMKTVMENHPCIKQYRRYVETATRTNRIESNRVLEPSICPHIIASYFISLLRSIGLFGCFDAYLPDGSNPQLQHTAIDKAFIEYKKVSITWRIEQKSPPSLLLLLNYVCP